MVTVVYRGILFPVSKVGSKPVPQVTYDAKVPELDQCETLSKAFLKSRNVSTCELMGLLRWDKILLKESSSCWKVERCFTKLN